MGDAWFCCLFVETIAETDAPTEVTDGDRSTTTEEAISAAFSVRFGGVLVGAFSALAMVMA